MQCGRQAEKPKKEKARVSDAARSAKKKMRCKGAFGSRGNKPSAEQGGETGNKNLAARGAGELFRAVAGSGEKEVNEVYRLLGGKNQHVFREEKEEARSRLT